jgi:hypothetical protein
LSRKLLLLNLALAVLVLATGWQIRNTIQGGEERKRAVTGRPLEPEPAAAESSLNPPPPAVAGAYFGVADKLLFVPDRNPAVIIEAAPPKPMPPLPVAHGILDLGAGPTVILSDAAGGVQRGYRVGDEYGDFRIVQITASSVVFEWEGERVHRTLEALKPKESAEAETAARNGAARPAKPKPGAKVIGGDEKPGPSEVDIGGGIRACKPGDDSPPGTVVGGYRKVVSETPFGRVCRWEPAG